MAKISGSIRPFIVDRLQNNSDGFNYWVNTLAGTPDYPNTLPFSMTLGTNLFALGLDEAEIDDTEIDSVYPLIMLKSGDADAQVFRYTPSVFSGSTETIVDFYSGFNTADVPLHSEELIDLVEDAMIETFNRYDEFTLYQNANIAYNNQIKWNRGKLARGGPNWRQKCRFRITMNLPSVEPR